jgi:hypothetical protein
MVAPCRWRRLRSASGLAGADCWDFRTRSGARAVPAAMGCATTRPGTIRPPMALSRNQRRFVSGMSRVQWAARTSCPARSDGDVVVDPTAERRVFRTPFRNAMVGAGYGVMAVIGLAGIAEYSDGNVDVGQLIFAIALAFGGGWFSIRGFRAVVTVSDSGVLKRGLLFSRSFPWSDIVDVEITVDHGLLNWRVPKLWLNSGKPVWLHEVGQWRSGPGRATELVTEVERHLADVSRAPSTGDAGDVENW